VFESLSAHELRGTPFVGGRRSSAVWGTDPLPAVIAKDDRGRLFPTRREDPAGSGILAVHYERRGAPLVTRGTRESGRFFAGR
jgi:hypothetical protein